tara:strand:- start:209 stop:463 length:255 start_codon:yes stop_codon:yes gene_type:complete
MKDKILKFMDEIAHILSIEYEYELLGDIIEVKTLSLFNDNYIVYSFKVLDGEVYFYSSNKKYELATEGLFCDEMMSQVQEIINE